MKQRVPLSALILSDRPVPSRRRKPPHGARAAKPFSDAGVDLSPLPPYLSLATYFLYTVP